jgi:hypothetical protein
VFSIRAVLNNSLTIWASVGQARQIFDPKFTIPHAARDITVSKAEYG